jgi:DMSO/TMAO reductase YedYZ molybdopterin-dependent catalytic subunit
MLDPACRLQRHVFLRALGSLWVPLLACEPESGGAAPWKAQPSSAPLGCPPFLTPLSEHFRQFGGQAHIDGWSMPDLGEDFELRIGGLCERELRVRLADLEAESGEHVRVLKTMVCVFGLHSTAVWSGVPLRVLLDRAGVDRTRGVRARFFGADGFENNLPLAAIYGDARGDGFEPLIAFQIYGEPLPRELGFPFRLLLADRYGYKNIKWLERVEISDRDEPTGHYQQSGYSDAGMIEPLVAAAGLRVQESLPVGPTQLCGFAVSGYSAVDQVEVSVEGGPFVAAELQSAAELREREPELVDGLQLPEADAAPGVWSAFRYDLDVQPGEQHVRIRVRDASGRTADATELRILGVSR